MLVSKSCGISDIMVDAIIMRVTVHTVSKSMRLNVAILSRNGLFQCVFPMTAYGYSSI